LSLHVFLPVLVALGETFSKIEGAKDGVKTVHLTGGAPIKADQVMLAIGRNPVTTDLGLETAGVEMDGRGFVKVDDYSKTNVNVFRAHFRPMKNTLSGSSEKMLMKIIVDAKTDMVVGLHIMGHGAGEMAQALGIAVKMKATKADFDRTMAVHPTAAEELVTMYSPSYTVVDGKRQES